MGWVQIDSKILLLALLLLGWGAVAAYLRFSGQRIGLLIVLCLALVGGAWAVSGRLHPSAHQDQAPGGSTVSWKTKAQAWLDQHVTPAFLPLACPRRALSKPRIGQDQSQLGAQGDLWEEYGKGAQEERGLGLFGQIRQRQTYYPPACWEKARQYARLFLLFFGGLLGILILSLFDRNRGKRER